MILGEAKKVFEERACDGFLFLFVVVLEIESELAQLLKNESCHLVFCEGYSIESLEKMDANCRSGESSNHRFRGH